jgi:hypothetical protein
MGGSKLYVRTNFNQIMRESAIHSKWLILSLSIGLILFMHFICQSDTEHKYKSLILLRKPGQLLFINLAISNVNVTMYRWVAVLGSKFDINDCHGH